MRKLLDGIEEAKPQIFLADVSQMIANQVLVVRSDRPDKYIRQPSPRMICRSQYDGYGRTPAANDPSFAIARAISESR
jgi:hypothetical protein